MARPSMENARDWAPRPVRDRLPGRPSGPIDTVKAEIRHRRRQRKLRGARRRVTGQITSRGAAMRGRMPSPPSISMPSISMPSVSMPSVSMPSMLSRPSVSTPRPPARRRRRRSSGRAGDLGMLVGAAAGYVLGTRAGQERYQQLVDQSRELLRRPQVQDAASKGRERVTSGVDRAAAQAGDALRRARQRRTETGGATETTPGTTSDPTTGTGATGGATPGTGGTGGTTPGTATGTPGTTGTGGATGTPRTPRSPRSAGGGGVRGDQPR
ncbi:MAG TPA: hypothetical protein VGC06_09265 [Actinomycetes bacterium]